MHPVPYPITTPYGVPGNWAAGIHTGDDYACPTGTPVVASVGGTVTASGWDDSYGWYVELDTHQIRHRYCHLRKQSDLRPPDYVGAGHLVGESGSTGNSTGPHVHYEERHSPFGYWDHRPPQFNHQGEQPEPAPQPPDESEEDDMKPWAVNAGTRGWVISDLCTYQCGVTDIAIVNEGVNFGAYQKFAGGQIVGPGWVDHIWRLPRVDVA